MLIINLASLLPTHFKLGSLLVLPPSPLHRFGSSRHHLPSNFEFFHLVNCHFFVFLCMHLCDCVVFMHVCLVSLNVCLYICLSLFVCYVFIVILFLWLYFSFTFFVCNLFININACVQDYCVTFKFSTTYILSLNCILQLHNCERK